MGFENFNPRDEKYKKVADLPKEEQENYRDTSKENGFITKEAFEEDNKNLREAEKINSDRSLLDKIFNRNKISKQDIAKIKAEIMDSDIEFEKLVLALPENEQEELRNLKGLEEELATGESEDGLEIYIDELSEKELENYGRYCALIRKAQEILKDKID